MIIPNKDYTDEELKEMFANASKIKDAKDIFVGVDWEEQQKGVDKVKATIKDWKAPDYNLSGMFCGDENKTLNKDSKAPNYDFSEMWNKIKFNQ